MPLPYSTHAHNSRPSCFDPRKQSSPISTPGRSHFRYSKGKSIYEWADGSVEVSVIIARKEWSTNVSLATVVQSSHPSARSFQQAPWWKKAGYVHPPTISHGQLSSTALGSKIPRAHSNMIDPPTYSGILSARPRLHLTPSQLPSQGYPFHIKTIGTLENP